MRRADREITDLHKIESILAGARYMHLGMFDECFPYVVPLHYGYELNDAKLTFYVHSAKEGHKLDCLRKNPHVFVEIDRGESLVTADIPCSYGAVYESHVQRPGNPVGRSCGKMQGSGTSHEDTDRRRSYHQRKDG